MMIKTSSFVIVAAVHSHVMKIEGPGFAADDGLSTLSEQLAIVENRIGVGSISDAYELAAAYA